MSRATPRRPRPRQGAVEVEQLPAGDRAHSVQVHSTWPWCDPSETDSARSNVADASAKRCRRSCARPTCSGTFTWAASAESSSSRQPRDRAIEPLAAESASGPAVSRRRQRPQRVGAGPTSGRRSAARAACSAQTPAPPARCASSRWSPARTRRRRARPGASSYAASRRRRRRRAPELRLDLGAGDHEREPLLGRLGPGEIEGFDECARPSCSRPASTSASARGAVSAARRAALVAGSRPQRRPVPVGGAGRRGRGGVAAARASARSPPRRPGGRSARRDRRGRRRRAAGLERGGRPLVRRQAPGGRRRVIDRRWTSGWRNANSRPSPVRADEVGRDEPVERGRVELQAGRGRGELGIERVAGDRGALEQGAEAAGSAASWAPTPRPACREAPRPTGRPRARARAGTADCRRPREPCAGARRVAHVVEKPQRGVVGQRRERELREPGRAARGVQEPPRRADSGAAAKTSRCGTRAAAAAGAGPAPATRRRPSAGRPAERRAGARAELLEQRPKRAVPAEALLCTRANRRRRPAERLGGRQHRARSGPSASSRSRSAPPRAHRARRPRGRTAPRARARRHGPRAPAAAARGALGDRRQQRGLADPGLAEHAEHARATAAHVVDRAGRQVEFAIAAGELHCGP